MNLLSALTRRTEQRGMWWPNMETLSYGGLEYPSMMGGLTQTLGFKVEDIEPTFGGFVGAYKSNGVVFACMLARMMPFAEARFQWRQVRATGVGDLFGTADLAVLEKPWPNATTGDMLSRIMQDADLAGNWFGVRDGDAIRRLRPDRVSIIAGSRSRPDDGMAASDVEVVGYIYHPGGGGATEAFLPEEMAHFAPIPDPAARFRGMSWLTPIVREIMADSGTTTHKLMTLEHGGTPNMVVKVDQPDRNKFKEWVETFKDQHEGVANAYRTLFIGPGWDATVVGANLRQMDFRSIQGAGETRIAAAARVPPIIVGLSEGLAAATYSNYGQARRAFADLTMRPLWRNICGSLESIVPPPGGAQLWYDETDIPFLAEDQKDRATIQQLDASAIATLVTAGYDPDSIVLAVTSGDLSRLIHTGLFSVQLQPPGPQAPPEPMPMTPPKAMPAAVAAAASRLVAAGVSEARIVEVLDVTDRTIRRWKA